MDQIITPQLITTSNFWSGLTGCNYQQNLFTLMAQQMHASLISIPYLFGSLPCLCLWYVFPFVRQRPLSAPRLLCLCTGEKLLLYLRHSLLCTGNKIRAWHSRQGGGTKRLATDTDRYQLCCPLHLSGDLGLTWSSLTYVMANVVDPTKLWKTDSPHQKGLGIDNLCLAT